MKKNLIGSVILTFAAIDGNAQDSTSIENVENSVELENKKTDEKIIVTGSRISRNDMEGSSPVTVIDREDIEKTGLTSIGDLLGTLSQTSFGNLKEESGHTRSGASRANLRGLGADKTLVLIDGHRMQVETSLGAPDLNHIPIGMVERIEILSDSASAVYGADAIGGVINVITKEYFSGSQVKFNQTSPSEEGGGDRSTADFTIGTIGERFKLVAGVSAKKTVGILEDDRPFFNGSSVYSPWGSYYTADGKFAPNENCPAERVVDLGNDNLVCGRAEGTHPYRIAYHEPDYRQLAGMTKFELDINDNIQMYGDLRYSYKEAEYAMLSTLFVAQQYVNPEYASTNLTQLDTGDEGTYFLYYIVDQFGHRKMNMKDTTGSAKAGLKGQLADFDWNLSISGDQSIADNHTQGQWDEIMANEMLYPASGNPLYDPVNRQSVLQDAQVSTFLKEVNENQRLTFDMTGELIDLPGGPIGVGLGFSMSQEEYDSDMSDIGKEVSADGQKRVSIAGGYGSGSRSIGSLYSEFLFPVAANFEVDLAARFDNYSDFGSTLNPKLAFAYRPVEQFLFRGSTSTGFKAPTLDLIHQTGGGGYISRVDQVQCAYDRANMEEGDSDPQSCEFPSNFLRERSGNEGLEEETSKSYALGLVLDFENVNFSTDFYEIIIENVIGLPDVDSILEKELNGEIEDLNSQGVFVERGSDQELLRMVVPYQNLGQQHARGFDFNLGANYRTSFASFNFESNLNRTIFFKEKDFPTDPLIDQLDKEGRPKWRMKNQIGMGISAHFVTLSASTISSHEKFNVTYTDDGDTIQERLPQYTSYNAQYAFNEFFSGRIAVGARNIFNSQGGVDNSNNPQRRETVNQDLYSIRGREYYMALTQNF